MKKNLKSVAYLFLGLFSFQISFFNTGLAQEFMPPGDVADLEAVARDLSVELNWNAAQDPDGVILGYKIYYGTTSVKTGNDSYADEILTGSSETSYTVSNLRNGVDYYFALTAIDDEENESENYSVEVSAMPMSMQTNNPSVVSVKQISETEVKVEMSEPVTVKSLTNSFSIEEKANKDGAVEIKTSKLNGTFVSLMVEKGSIKPETIYKVTATSTVEDFTGNPVSSGITDSAEFLSMKTPKELPVIEEPAMEEPNIEIPEINEDEEPFFIVPPQMEDQEHTSAPEQEEDKTPPLSVQNIIIDNTNFEKDGYIILTWTPAVDIETDITDQVFFTRIEGGEWDNGYSLGKDTVEIEVDVEKDTNYEIKIVTVDSSDNQTESKILKFSTKLTKTGPGGVIGLIITFTIALFILGGRRRTV
ncbi:fibronectin type III domain-containing protein [Candidatus Gracilibacteria bacterium]|nr:fibronectin type III domain-containing protein [Candidatus Gracilibacteria bacterium]